MTLVTSCPFTQNFHKYTPRRQDKGQNSLFKYLRCSTVKNEVPVTQHLHPSQITPLDFRDDAAKGERSQPLSSKLPRGMLFPHMSQIINEESAYK